MPSPVHPTTPPHPPSSGGGGVMAENLSRFGLTAAANPYLNQVILIIKKQDVYLCVCKIEPKDLGNRATEPIWISITG